MFREQLFVTADKFIDKFLTKEGETIEEAKERMNADIEKRSGLK